MAAFAVDTSCMVAAVCSWHEHHEAAATEIERRLTARETLVVPAPALVEAYAVLTRLPPPHRLSPGDAWKLVSSNFVEHAAIATLDRDDYVAVVREIAESNQAGGRTYDAVIGACARLGRAKALLTFNRRHFDPPPHGVTVVVPTTARAS